MPILQNKSLFRNQCYLNGEWLDADNNNTIDVANPATGKVIGSVPNMGKNETRQVIESANNAWQGWKSMTAKDRAKILKKWYDLIVENVDDLAHILTVEQGKPLAESKGEILNGAGFIEWFAEEGKRIYGDIIPTHEKNTRIMVIKQSIGVSAAITPWNFPSSMITRKASAALAAGCPVILKPSELTPFSALALADLAAKAGIPAGTFNVITGDAKAIGQELCENKLVRKLSFTGSTNVGKILMRQCAETVKKISLELGGNAPFIVFDDADIVLAITGLMASKYRNSGQTCICANRIFVQSNLYDEFIDKLTIAVEKMSIGNGLDATTNMGPLINNMGLEKVKTHIDDAIAKGAKIITGGESNQLFYQPTILKDATDDMLCFSEEIFGPVAPIFKFNDENEVIDRANNTEYGLAAYIYTKDLGRFFRVSENLEYGMVGVNSGLLSTEQAPFGGIKQSGIGREGSKYGIEDYVEIKYLCVGGL